ncbi:MAG: butyrate kinase [Defluviitaleaceae bacterium]|nr:butyrate kinase [Defluviitaleaceae bacterium]
MKLLIINPGSTSTKISVYEDENPIFDQDLHHEMSELAVFEKITDQYDFRKKVILDALKEAGIAIESLDAIVDRGGLLKPLAGGTYRINEAIVRDLRNGVQGEHASNLGGLIAYEIGEQIGKPAFVVDPVVVDELDPISRISGHPWLERRSVFHALNQKAIARQYCREVGKAYQDVSVIVAHLGGGISVGIHHKGRVIDVSNALHGEGPFTPERSGALPVGELAALCFSGTKTLPEIKKALTGQGGIVAYLGSNDVKAMVEKAQTDPEAKNIIDAMIYQISKEIAAVSTAVNGKVNAILLTGGLAFGKYITQGITDRVGFIAEVRVYPGGHEQLALAQGALRVLKGEEEAKVYE